MDERLTVSDGRGTVDAEWHLPQPPEAVWHALVDAGALDAWFPAHAEIEPRTGGAVRFTFDGADDSTLGRVTAYEEGRAIAYTWGDDLLAWRVDGEGGGTVLSLAHTFDDVPGAASFAAGWAGCVRALAAHLAGEEPGEFDWAAAHEAFTARFGLDRGTAVGGDADGWTVRFERQLTTPVEEVWRRLDGPGFDDAGAPVPAAFTVAGFTPGPLTGVEAPHLAAYRWLDGDAVAGDVRWELNEGPGGARLTVTHTGAEAGAAVRDAAYAAWHDAIEALAARLRGGG